MRINYKMRNEICETKNVKQKIKIRKTKNVNKLQLICNYKYTKNKNAIKFISNKKRVIKFRFNKNNGAK